MNIYKALKTKKVLGFVIGALVVIGLVGIAPRILHSQGTEREEQDVLLFWGIATDAMGNPKPVDTPVYATRVGNPQVYIEGRVKLPNGYYEIKGSEDYIGYQYYLNYVPGANDGSGPASPPTQVNISPGYW